MRVKNPNLFKFANRFMTTFGTDFDPFAWSSYDTRRQRDPLTLRGDHGPVKSEQVASFDGSNKPPTASVGTNRHSPATPGFDFGNTRASRVLGIGRRLLARHRNAHARRWQFEIFAGT
jgi:hypothetical protein